MAGEQFATYAEAVAKELLGAPNKAMSTSGELRFGSHGSLSVDIKKGTFYDHESQTGGGVLDLIERETGSKGAAAVEWLRERGFHVDDGDDRQARRRNAPPRDEQPAPTGEAPRWRITKTWDYVDEAGELLFQVVRQENGERSADGKAEKKYLQRRKSRPDDDPEKIKNGWVWTTKDCRQVPYRLPEIMEAIASDFVIFTVEGEKAADALWDIGVPATTNARGAGKWPKELNEFFRDARIVSLPDNDPQARNKDGTLRYHEDGRPYYVGRAHVEMVAKELKGIAREHRVLDLPGLPEKGDAFDWVASGGTAEALYDLVARFAKPIEQAPFHSRFRAVTWSDLDAPGPEHEWLIKGVLTRGERSMTAGPSQSGKSFLVLDQAMAIARGVEWMGCRTLHGGVIYQAGEGGKGIKKRLRAYRQANGLSLDENLPFVLLPSPIDLYANDDHTNMLIDEIMHWADTFPVPLELIVLDTLSAATPGANENASEDMSRVLARAERIVDATKAHVMLVHHMNAEGSRPRGHTSIFANLDNVVTVRKVEGLHDGDGRPIREAKVAKQKDGEDGGTFRFVLPAVQIGTDIDGDAITSCVVKSPNEDGVNEEAGKSKKGGLTDIEKIFMAALLDALDARGVPTPTMLKLPRSISTVVDYNAFKEAFVRRNPKDGDEDDKKWRENIKKRLQRSREALWRKGYIGVDTPYIWSTGKAQRAQKPTEALPDEKPREDDGGFAL